MADEYKAESGSPGGLYRQFKQTGYHPVSGVPVYAEVLSLEATSIGGGGSNTQYTEGDTDSTITGTAMLWEDTSDTLRAISAAKPLPVNVVAGGAGGGAVTVADAADVTLGALADAAVGDAAGTVNSHLRQIAKVITAGVTVTNAGTFAVQAAATLAAETTKVIGVTRTADGSGNLLTSTSNALDVNLKTSAATNISSNVAQINGVTPLMGAGNTGTGSLRVTVASDQASIAVAATLAAETTKVIGVTRAADGSGNLLTSTSNALDVNIKASAASNISTNVAQINGVTPLMGTGNTGTGSPRVTIATDQANLTTALNTFLVPQTSGGLLIANMTSGDTFTALTNSAQAIKASAGQLFGWYIYNPNATAAYVNIYNTAAASVTVGTTTPAINICIPATSAANVLGETGIQFTNAGWSASATTTGGGNTAPTTALEANFFYK